MLAVRRMTTIVGHVRCQTAAAAAAAGHLHCEPEKNRTKNMFPQQIRTWHDHTP